MSFYALCFSREFSWGDTVKMGVSKKFVDGLIKNYVEETYPQKVKNFKEKLLQIRKEKLKKYENVIYLSSGLMWQDDIPNKELKVNALEATRYCRELHHATKKDWRVPLYHELLELVNYFRYDPAVQDEIKNIAADKYWTASNDVKDYSAAWYVDFKYGETGASLRISRYHVRCVRSLSDQEDDF